MSEESSSAQAGTRTISRRLFLQSAGVATVSAAHADRYLNPSPVPTFAPLPVIPVHAASLHVSDAYLCFPKSYTVAVMG
jgi:hypothetical protein